MKRDTLIGRRLGGLLTVAAALAFLVAVPVAAAQDSMQESLPPAEKILDQYVAAMGGKAALEKIKNRVVKASFEVVGMGMKGHAVIYEAAPNKQFSVFEMEGMGTTEQGFDGKVAWEKSMMAGSRIKEGEELAETAQDAIFNSEMLWREVYEKVETIDSETVEGTDAWVVKAVPKAGKPKKLYIDKKSHLMVKEVTRSQSQMGEVDVEVFAGDYREVDGIRYPYSMRQVMMGGQMTMQMTVQSIQHNQEIPEGTFEVPEELKSQVGSGN